MSFYIFAWIASIFYAFEAVAGKLLSKYTIKNPWLFNFIWALFDLVLIGIAALANHVVMPHHWGLLVTASIFYALGGLFYILGIYYFDISSLAPLYNFRSVFAIILSAMLLHEVLLPVQYFLILLIFIMGIFVTMDERFSFKSFFSWPMLIIMTDMLGLSLMGIFIKKSIAVDGYWPVTLWLAIICQLFLLLTVPWFWKDAKNIFLKQMPGIFLMAVFGFIATLAANKAYATNVGISSTIIGLPLSMVLVFLIAWIMPDLLEKHSVKVYALRFGAAAVMLVAALFLSK